MPLPLADLPASRIEDQAWVPLQKGGPNGMLSVFTVEDNDQPKSLPIARVLEKEKLAKESAADVVMSGPDVPSLRFTKRKADTSNDDGPALKKAKIQPSL
ncbi:hypothetical protein H0H92_008396, partial [Tricholoma furcatifolium]